MELVDIVDENNQLTGQVEERWDAYNKGLWRRTVSCWIMNEKGEVLLQKEEVAEVKYFTIEELEKAKKNNDINYTFCNWNEEDFEREINLLKNKRKEILEKKVNE